MMFKDTLEVIRSIIGGLDDNGDPVAARAALDDPIKCNIKTIKHNNKGVSIDGTFKQASYEILIKLQDFDAELLTITNSRNKNLGVYDIQDIEFLDVVKRVKITV